jgi:transcriptional regulator with XRE-family HTH domain
MPSRAYLGQAFVFLAQIDGVNQTQLAAKAGLSVSTVSAAAQGRRETAPRTLKKLRSALAPTEKQISGVLAVIQDRRAMNQSLDTADSISEATGAGYLDDDRAREIGRALLRIFELAEQAPTRKTRS